MPLPAFLNNPIYLGSSYFEDVSAATQNLQVALYARSTVTEGLCTLTLKGSSLAPAVAPLVEPHTAPFARCDSPEPSLARLPAALALPVVTVCSAERLGVGTRRPWEQGPLSGETAGGLRQWPRLACRPPAPARRALVETEMELDPGRRTLNSRASISLYT